MLPSPRSCRGLRRPAAVVHGNSSIVFAVSATRSTFRADPEAQHNPVRKAQNIRTAGELPAARLAPVYVTLLIVTPVPTRLCASACRRQGGIRQIVHLDPGVCAQPIHSRTKLPPGSLSCHCDSSSSVLASCRRREASNDDARLPRSQRRAVHLPPCMRDCRRNAPLKVHCLRCRRIRQYDLQRLRLAVNPLFVINAVRSSQSRRNPPRSPAKVYRR